MEQKSKSGKIRKIILCISPNCMIKENLWDKSFAQILSVISRFKAFELKTENMSIEKRSCAKAYFLILNDPSNEKRVLQIIRKFNFEKIS